MCKLKWPLDILGGLDDDHRNDFTDMEKFTCKMYGKKDLKKK